MTASKYRLGAEELIELGRGEASKEPRKPFFLGRVRLSDMEMGREGAVEYLAGKFRQEAGILERLSGTSTLADVVRRAPVIREAVAGVLVLGDAVTGNEAELSGDSRALFGGVLEVLEGSGTPQENGILLQAAAERLASGAPEGVKSSVKEILGVG